MKEMGTPMNLESIQSELAGITKGSSFSERQAFIKTLLSLTSEEAVKYHFDLLKLRENLDLYEELRAAFAKRGKVVEDFLLDRARNDEDIIAAGDALQLLGVLRSPSAVPLAKEFLRSRNDEARYKGVIVLGWI